MAENPFDYPLRLDDLESGIEALPNPHRIAFAASICERLLPNYAAFYRTENWGNLSMLRTALDEVWQILQEKPVDAARIRQLRDACESEDVMPDSEDFSESRYDGQAREAVIAIIYTLDACIEPSLSCIIEVVNCALRTIDFALYLEYFFMEGGPDDILKILDKEIVNHPWTLRELAKQREDLENLRNAKTLDREFLSRLRNSFNNDGKSLIDLG
ncbi:MAG: YjaG family protein [Oscillatoria princeps RMCB-10]|jgi:uncharacterized protein YjaG (DUF416 family)|nr:YjaG family protein [Oscillatoria princeps RMCB-10]